MEAEAEDAGLMARSTLELVRELSRNHQAVKDAVFAKGGAVTFKPTPSSGGLTFEKDNDVDLIALPPCPRGRQIPVSLFAYCTIDPMLKFILISFSSDYWPIVGQS